MTPPDSGPGSADRGHSALLTPAGPGQPPAPAPTPGSGAAGILTQIHAQVDRYDALDHAAQVTPGRLSERDRLLHIKNLCRDIARLHASPDPPAAAVRSRLVAVAAQAVRWIDHLDRQP